MNLEKMFQMQAECANEWRGFKFWSNDQQPREEKLLEEYVDCLHFILSIGNLTKYSKNNDVNDLKRNTLEASGVNAFLELFKEITFFNEVRKVSKNTIEPAHIMIYERIFRSFIELGDFLGFTPEQIEDEYMKKNAVNHKRQQEGY
ncbi:dUTP diphosphatase [Bacillus aerius]|uniref:dUTP diphosphatase n=1 Tax=Bacillus aerius TaxID=293388 RepID=UPI0028164F56|nr:dUTP diphosphatase [Bacillus aerius]WMT29979.1 dUTP diphosphatase [Bacillus aerius]